MKILVTGGAGFIGSHMCEALLAHEHSVVALDNFESTYSRKRKRRNIAAALQHPNYTLVECDFGDRLAVSDVLKVENVELVLHLGGVSGARLSAHDPLKFERLNVGGLIPLLEAMKEHGPRRLIAASSGFVYGKNAPLPSREDAPCMEPLSPYGATKRAMEIFLSTYCRLYGFQVAAARLFTVYGPRQRPDMAIASFARNLLSGDPLPLYGDGSLSRDYTYISDIVEGLLALVQRFPSEFRIYNLGCGNSAPLKEVIASLERITGKQAKFDNQGRQPGEVACTCADIALARKELEYNPKISLEQGLEKTVNWVRQELRLEGVAIA